MPDKYVPRVLINGRETVDRTEYLEYIEDNTIDIGIAKSNIERYLFRFIRKNTSCAYEMPNMISYAVESVEDEIYYRALLCHKPDGAINYIRILANRLASLLDTTCHPPYDMNGLVEFLYSQIR